MKKANHGQSGSVKGFWWRVAARRRRALRLRRRAMGEFLESRRLLAGDLASDLAGSFDSEWLLWPADEESTTASFTVASGDYSASVLAGDGQGSGSEGDDPDFEAGGELGGGDSGSGSGDSDSGSGDSDSGSGDSDSGSGDSGSGSGDSGSGDGSTGEGDGDGSEGGDSGGGDSAGGSGECEGGAISLLVPERVDEYQVFTVSGTAPGADYVQISATGLWALVGSLGGASGYSFNPATGAFSQMMLFKDDRVIGTAEDLEMVTVTAGGACGGSASAPIVVRNVDVAVTAELDQVEINEGDTVQLDVTLTDAVLDGQKIVVDWGDGEISEIQYADQVDWGLQEILDFLELPQRVTFRESFAHRYRDDNPSSTARDDYAITVRVTDNDTSTESTTQLLTVNNLDPRVVIERVVPLDDKVLNDRIDEGERFQVVGTVSDVGSWDSQALTLSADLNFDGDTDDPGEQLHAMGSGSSWGFQLTFAAVWDDGPAPGNGTAQDELTILVQVVDDDTGTGSGGRVVTVYDVAPEIHKSTTKFDVTYDAEGNVAQVKLSGSFRDPGLDDRHTLQAQWGDGETTTGQVIGSGEVRGFEFIRNLPPSFGSSAIRLFPVEMQIKDDDGLDDSLQILGEVAWWFDPVAAKSKVGGIAPRKVAERDVGASWIGYWTSRSEINFDEVVAGSNEVTGNAWVMSAWNQHDLSATPDFSDPSRTKATAYQQDFVMTCDRTSGQLVFTAKSETSGFTPVLNPDGTFIEKDESNRSPRKTGAVAAYGSVKVDYVTSAHIGVVSINQSMGAALADPIQLVDKSGGALNVLKGIGSLISGTEAHYSGGISDAYNEGNSYICREHVVLTFRND